MDFALSDAHEALADLARTILTERSTQERLDALDAGEEWLDRELQVELAEAGLLGIALPEEHGGGGLDFLAVHLLLRFTLLGKKMRAVADDPMLARVSGISAQGVLSATWFTSAAIGELETALRIAPKPRLT